MKKVVFLLIIAFFLAGCTAEWYKHDTIYKDHDHMFFSWGDIKALPRKNSKNLSRKDGGARKSPISPQNKSLGLESGGIISVDLMMSFRLYR